MDDELIYYIISYCRDWMLPEEKRALTRVGLTHSGEITMIQAAAAEKKIELIYGFSDEKTNELVNLGEADLKRKIAERIYKDHRNEAINLCSKCGRLTRTPNSKQCRHCGHDWH
jgi:hypothetical protein